MPGAGKKLSRPSPVSQDFERRIQIQLDRLFRASVHAIKIIRAAWKTDTELFGCNPGALRPGPVYAIRTELYAESAIIACFVYCYAVFTEGISEATWHRSNFRQFV
jgi:hypothetical protein